MRLLGANPNPRVTGERKLSGVTNYLIGNDPKKWRTNVPHYDRVRYHAVYPGIDTVYHGENGLEYDFVVAPGVDPSRIAPAFPGSRSQRLEPETGDLLLDTGNGEVRQQRPVAYQEFDGHRRQVQAEWVLDSALQKTRTGSTVASFHLGDYDHSRPLVIDPVLVYSTYLDGSDSDAGSGIAVDGNGSAYVTGWTRSTDFPVQNQWQPYPNDATYNAFVTKLSPAGNTLVYSTYLGGSADDYGQAIKVGSDGTAHISGTTGSTNFPTINAYQTDPADANYDAFVARLSPGGSLEYSTYLGGNGYEKGNALAIDDAGHAYVAGETTSTNFPTVNPVQGAPVDSTSDVFVTKVSPFGDSLVYSTYLRGASNEFGYGIAIDDAGCAYVTGGTESSTFPTAKPLQFHQGGMDAFVTKISSQGSSLVYSTFLGGANGDRGYGIAVDSERCTYVTGSTDSSLFPTVHAYQSQAGSSWNDAFICKISRYGRALEYSSFLGGGGVDEGVAVAVDSEGHAYVTGSTDSSGFPAENGLISLTDVFVTRFSTTGNTLDYSRLLGGDDVERGNGIAVDDAGSAYVAGQTFSSEEFPLVNPFQSEISLNDSSAFVSRLDPYSAPSALAATPTSRAMLLTWTENATGEQGYEIERRILGGIFVSAGQAEPDSTSLFDGNLSPGTQYDYRVRAYGRQGHSPWAGPLPAFTLPEPPAAPSGLYATATAANQLTLRWTDNASNETGFLLQRSTNRTTWTQVVDGTSNTILFTDTGLTTGTTYYYRVRAYNTGGVSAWNEATGTVRPGIPTAPEGLRAVALIATQLFLTWQDRSSTETGFRLERKLVGGSYATAALLSPNVNAYVDKNLAAGTSYIYRLYAFNVAGDSAPTGEFTATTLPSVPTAPSGLTATPLSNRVVALAWTDNSSNETEFRLERRNGAAAYAQIAVIVANGTSFFDSAVAPSTTYTYRIRAANSGGTSAYSNQVNGATPAGVSDGVLQVRPSAIRFTGVAPGTLKHEKLTVKNSGKGRLKVVVGQLAPPFAVLGTRTFTLKPKEQKVLRVRYTATPDSKGTATTLGVAGSGRKNPMVCVSITAN